jgi:hypothetical protein
MSPQGLFPVLQREAGSTVLQGYFGVMRARITVSPARRQSKLPGGSSIRFQEMRLQVTKRFIVAF